MTFAEMDRIADVLRKIYRTSDRRCRDLTQNEWRALVQIVESELTHGA